MIEEFLKVEKEAIDRELKDYFAYLNENEKEILLKDFFAQLQEFILNKNAKRLHSILLIAAFVGIVNPINLDHQIDQIRKVSLAVEFLHSGHLIHDDLIDDDNERRSKPTFHAQLKNELSKVYDKIEICNKNEIIQMYGRDMSILGGTQGYLLGLNVIKSSKFSEKLKLLAINEYTSAMDNLMKGQIIEEYMNYHNITMSLEQYLIIAEMQRASLLEKSAKIGAILAKGNNHYQINPLSRAMNLMGQAFAIRDDIIDLISDIKARKKKIIYIFAVQNTDEEQSKTLNEIYHLDELSKNDVKTVETIFAETNSVIIAEHFSKNLINQAKASLKNIYPDLNKNQKTFFNEFSDYLYMKRF
ncbi:MAG TPA: polyprenyl synthetase family protein [Candidatus Nanopelagicaceae bacterium]|nr:polyprenyl synthetase family protein [Candidatus Nanopelagicaceae bacterium]